MACFRLEYSRLNARICTEFRTVKKGTSYPDNISNIGLYMGYQTDYIPTHDYQLTDSAKLLRALKVRDHVSLDDWHAEVALVDSIFLYHGL